MAKNNEVMAKVRVTIGGVEASKKNLNALQTAAEQLSAKVKELNAKKVKLVDANDVKGADAVVKEMNKINASLKATREMIRLQENELNNYTNILENLAGTPLASLQKGLRDLQAQMKQTLTLNDVERYKKLKEAYDQVLDSVNQLSGKAPNLNYVLSNLGNTASKTLKDSVEYVKKMISETDKGSARLVGLQTQLAKLEGEQQRRLTESANTAMGNVDGKSFAGTEAEAKQALETLKEYKATLNLSTQAAEVQKVNTAMNAYNEALEKVKGTAIDVGKILDDPKQFSIDQIEKAIKQLEEDGKKIKIGDTDAIQKNVADIEKLKTALADSAHSQNFIDNVVKDAKDGNASMVDLERAIAMTKEKLRHSKDATMTEKLRQDLDKLNPALELTRTSLTRVNATLGNIKGSNLGSLKEAAERLKVELNDVNLKVEDFAKKAAQLKKVNAQIKELESQTKNVASAWDNAVSRLQNWVLIYAGSQQIWDKMVQTYKSALKLSDAMTDVRKTTGLSADEVERLTDEIQELDTRITNEKLMEAATEAGRIGLKTRQEVLEFTRASAITLTALDELDARSITSVMKLNSLLGETARLGVQQAILSTASSINELSMASSAAQQPIIDFSRRFGGIAAQANISTAEVLGLGATIDALGQPIEMSSTALNKFTTALLSNGKQIAEDTGLSEEYVFEMTRQGKTIELMIEVLSKLNSMGGIGEISKYMGDMGGDGARMTAVVSALAANLGFLREQIDLSKMSFEEGISVINEYNLKNENAAALVARIGNDLKEYWVNSRLVSILTSLLSVLQSVVSFLTGSSVAAKAARYTLLLLVTTLANLNKGFRAFNEGVTKASFSLKGLATSASAAGKALWGLFKSNPVGWILVAVNVVWDLVAAMVGTEEQTEKTKSAIDRANESFEEEAYKLNKLRDSLKEVKDDKAKLTEIASTLNRDYGKELGYVVSMTASYQELAGAIDLVTAAKRKQILQQEKDKNFQNVQDEFREQTNAQINLLKKEIGIGSGKNGWFEEFSATAQKDLYSAIAQDLNKSASTKGTAELGEEVEKVLRSQAKAAAQNFFRVAYKMTDEQLAAVDTSQKEQEIYEGYQERLKNMDSVVKLGEIYSQKVTKLKELDEEVDRQLVTASAKLAEQQQTQIDLLASENDLSNKAAKDFTAEDENTLNGIISLYESMLIGIDKSTDLNRWNDINNQVKFFKLRQREVMLAFVENPLRGIKMKVGEDGKLYKEVLENGKYQYEAVKELSDANLRQLVDAYRRTETTFQKLISDENHLMDSEVRAQAEHLSKVKTAINNELKKNGIDIDDKGNLKLRNTEYRDGSGRTARQEDSEMRKAYQALLNNIKEFYEKKKQMVLDAFINERATVEQKNRRIEELTKQHNETVVAMQTELLGEGNAFNEAAFIRNQANFKKVAGWMLKDTHHFQDEVRKARAVLQTDTTEQEVKYREEVVKILLGNDYQAQVDKEMQEAFEKADLFWFGLEHRSAVYADTVTATLKHFAKDAYAVEKSELIKRLQAHSVFGEDIKDLTEEQQNALILLLQQFHDKTVEADKKFADQRRKITKQMWADSGYSNQYNSASESIANRQANIETEQGFGAKSDRKAYKEQYRLMLEQWALEEWHYQMEYEMAVKAGETEEQLLERRIEMANMEKEMQRQITEAYMEEYDRRTEMWSQHAGEFGKFAGVMASAAWNSVEDRKKAGEELLKYIAEETTEYIRELLVRKIKEEVLRRQGLKEAKKGEEEKQDIEQKGVEESTKIAEIGGKIKTGIEEKITGEIGSIAESGAVQSATTAVKKANVDAAAGVASGAAKTIGELGWWGIPLIAAIEGVISMLLNMAMSALSSSFGSSASTGKTNSKRLATGMLTYASGRYPVEGDDGVTYSAQYEPSLQTKIYDGGKGRAHMALFSEVMPEMVVSGPTTKIIQEDYPSLMNAIMTIDRYGTLPQPRRMRRYESGNVDEFDVDMMQGADGTYTESPAIAELRQSNAELRDAVARLATILENGIHANINMYGTGGIKESMDKANKFYTKNRIK